LSRTQIEELAHFIHLQVYETLRGAPAFRPHDVVTGDAQAGAAFFHGAGTCATCHSPAGDLAGIGRRYAPAALQERFISPRGGRRGAPRRPVMVTVTPSSSPPVTGVLVALDDFHVALRDDAGEYRSWKRTAALKVVKDDPYAAHDALLEKYTDKNMHDLLAYLMTLK
jgi:cytochrome c553